MKTINALLISLFSAFWLLPLSSQAAIYSYASGPGQLGHDSHNASYDRIFTSYNDDSEEFIWEAEGITKDGYGGPDGFWLVVNAGGNPKGADVNELAIFYADLNTERLWAYAYNGANNSNSWSEPGILINSYFDGELSVTENAFRFQIDATDINNFEHDEITEANEQNGGMWSGVQFFESIGIWFHPVWGLTSETLSDSIAEMPFLTVGTAPIGDQLTQFDYDKSTWFDTEYLDTKVSAVPLPASIWFLGSSLLALLVISRRSTS